MVHRYRRQPVGLALVAKRLDVVGGDFVQRFGSKCHRRVRARQHESGDRTETILMDPPGHEFEPTLAFYSSDNAAKVSVCDFVGWYTAASLNIPALIASRILSASSRTSAQLPRCRL